MTSNERRLEQLAVTHAARVLSYLGRRSSSADDAADVFQAVLVTAWRRLDDVPVDDDAALAWLLATARRCLANDRRGRTRRLQATERLRASISIPAAPRPDDRATVIDEALAVLAEADRELVQLVYWEDLTVEQAGKVLEISSAAARKRLERARHRMRGYLEAAARGGVSAV